MFNFSANNLIIISKTCMRSVKFCHILKIGLAVGTYLN